MLRPSCEELTMARAAHDTMMNPPIEELLGRVDSKFALVTLAARRARQINSYFNHLGDSLGTMVPPQVTSVARKPLSIGFEEIAADKIAYDRIEVEVEGGEVDVDVELAVIEGGDVAPAGEGE
jgi:DNA-directed RNA polymerase subunit omega